MKTLRLNICCSGLLLLAACAEEAPPISVEELMENPRLLEATMVRCGENRSEMKYEVECVRARDAINRLESRQEQARREDLEAQSERKRQALRRTQAAAAEARRRAEEERRRREQAELLGVVDGEIPEGAVIEIEPGPATDATTTADGNAPLVEIAPPEPETVEEIIQFVEPEPEAGVGDDLESIREELKRRQEDPQ
jgi:hypothetical protein